MAELDQPIRLNKYIAMSGMCSRRKADDFIQEGRVTVNGQVVQEMGYKVNPGDVVTFDGNEIKAEKLVYVLLNKPKGFITTTRDEKDRKTVLDLVKRASSSRLYPVGRLDRGTTGLLIMTNDGELAQKLAHPSFNVQKIYYATLDQPLQEEHILAIRSGIELSDGPIKVDEIGYPDMDDRTKVGIEIHSGKNRIVRRIFEHFGYFVKKLDRVLYAGLTKKDLPRGKWRYLSEHEVIRLKHFTNSKETNS